MLISHETSFYWAPKQTLGLKKYDGTKNYILMLMQAKAKFGKWRFQNVLNKRVPLIVSNVY